MGARGGRPRRVSGPSQLIRTRNANSKTRIRGRETRNRDPRSPGPRPLPSNAKTQNRKRKVRNPTTAHAGSKRAIENAKFEIQTQGWTDPDPSRQTRNRKRKIRNPGLKPGLPGTRTLRSAGARTVCGDRGCGSTGTGDRGCGEYRDRGSGRVHGAMPMGARGRACHIHDGWMRQFPSQNAQFLSLPTANQAPASSGMRTHDV